MQNDHDVTRMCQEALPDSALAVVVAYTHVRDQQGREHLQQRPARDVLADMRTRVSALKQPQSSRLTSEYAHLTRAQTKCASIRVHRGTRESAAAFGLRKC